MFLVLLGLTLFFGCSHGGVPKDFPPLHPCVITVIQDGAPLEGASVSLKPLQSSAMSASGITDAEGIAVMKVQAAYDGVPEGNYKVLIVKQTRERNPAVKDADSREEVSAEFRDREYIVTDFVHPKFGNAAQTPLEIQIQSGKNEHTFEVTK